MPSGMDDDMRMESGPGRVLVVDDSRVVRAIVCEFLRRAGYTVEQAEDGQKGFELLAKGRFDVIISDLAMPHRDGFWLLQQAKSRPDRPEVILLTGTRSQDVEAAVRALRLGAHDYLSKPISNPEELVLSVERAVQTKRLRDANRHLIERLEELSRTDALTGAFNRRAFDEALARETASAERYGAPFGLVIFDLDFFKRVNDLHGHEAGDKVLRHFARVVRSTLRDCDLLYRYGGEEFAALLPQTGLAGAIASATRVVRAVAQSRLRLDGAELGLTCSAGAAATDTCPAADLVAEADEALYEAKQAGRNRAHARGARGRTRIASRVVAEPSVAQAVRVPRAGSAGAES